MSNKLQIKVKEQIKETEDPGSSRFRDWVFTLNNYQSQDIQAIQTIKSNYQVFGKEVAPTTGTPHLQGYIYFANPLTKMSVLKRFKEANITNEVYVAPRFRASTPEKASAYCKKDKPIGDIYEQGTLPNNPGSRTDIDELKNDIKSGLSYEKIQDKYTMYALRYGRSLQTLYEALRPKPIFDLKEEYATLRPFQETIIDYIKQKPDKRKILWIVDTTGASGKSELADHLMDNYNFIAINNGKTADMAYLWKGENIVMDLSRTQQDHINYEAIEQLKNGRIMSSKYESCIKRYNRPHFVVMANYEPETKSMSQDRWDIRYINENYELITHSIPIKPLSQEIIYSEDDVPTETIRLLEQEIAKLRDQLNQSKHHK